MKNDVPKSDIRVILLTLNIDESNITPEVYNFTKECIEMIKLYAKKNHDYGNSFDRGMDVIGLPYGVGRIFDKMNRIITLMKVKAEIYDESILDTIEDLACYGVMLTSYIKNPRTK